MDKKYRYTVEVAHAHKVEKWLKERGGILLWGSIDLSDLGKSMVTPALDDTGHPVAKPSYQMGNTPADHITSINDVGVIEAKELKRFHVGTRVGSQGFTVKVTDGGTRRIRSEVAKAKEKHGWAWYEFDYGDERNAVIMVAGDTVPLTEWVEKNP